MNAFSGKTVLVTGATGLLGSSIVDRFISMGDVEVFALAKFKSRLTKRFKEYIGISNFHIITQDICASMKLPESTTVDYIFHAAGTMTGVAISHRPMDVIDANLIGTRNCLDLLNEQKRKQGHSGRFVLFSSVAVYGNHSGIERTVTEIDTDIAGTLDVPHAAYTETKRMSEVLTLAYHRSFGVDVVIGRFSTVYGLTRYNPDTAIFEFLLHSVRGEDIVLRRSDLPRKDTIYIDDAVAGILLVASCGGTGESYNISSNGEKNNFAALDEIAQMIACIANRKHVERQMQVYYRSHARLERIPGLKMDNAKLKSLGWSLTTSLEEGIEKMMDKMEQTDRNVQT